MTREFVDAEGRVEPLYYSVLIISTIIRSGREGRIYVQLLLGAYRL